MRAAYGFQDIRKHIACRHHLKTLFWGHVPRSDITERIAPLVEVVGDRLRAGRLSYSGEVVSGIHMPAAKPK